MDHPDKIKPALTSEEWEERLARKSATDFPVPPHDSLEWLHRTAALALYGQEFGFTREDIRALRVAAQAADEDGYYFRNDGQRQCEKCETIFPASITSESQG